jgi:UDP-N-acetylmuramoyl-L-alanyl-D-glutamate--2,6-diaminopimelate ligase
MLAQPGDVILVAGKGHEDYQIIQGVKYHFDDHEVIREAFGITEA